jgi:hypothetical protein
MRGFTAVVLALLALVSWAQSPPQKRLLLVPLDSRPAAGQFAQMIARMAGLRVDLPPEHLLGRYTTPGDPEGILDWLERQDFRTVDSLVVSTDMIAYGGLIASRVADTPYDQALQRLKRLAAIRRFAPDLRIYAMTSIMRLAPTAMRANAAWRMQLSRFVELRDTYRRFGQQNLLPRLRNLRAMIPVGEIEKYDAARKRSFDINMQLVEMTEQFVFDYLILGQDDAKPMGPHVPETMKLKKKVEELGLEAKVYFCEGIDQHANVLVSRALLRSQNWTPRVRIVYSDEAQRRTVAPYESKSIEQSLADQLIASGAAPAEEGGDYDYTLFVNVPKYRPEEFERFKEVIAQEIDQGFPVAVADINLGNDGTADPKLFALLSQQGRFYRLLAYAGWNTAGNTMGTAIPAANVYLFARRFDVDPLKRELAQREFLLHRIVNDFEYHKFTRPKAYALIDSLPDASREETYGEDFEAVDTLVRSDLRQHLDATFASEFGGKRFFAGTQAYQVVGLSDVRIYLPWPRAYEVRLEFRLRASPVSN